MTGRRSGGRDGERKGGEERAGWDLLGKRGAGGGGGGNTHRARGTLVKFFALRVLPSEEVASGFDDSELHAKADAEEGFLLGAGKLN